MSNNWFKLETRQVKKTREMLISYGPTMKKKKRNFSIHSSRLNFHVNQNPFTSTLNLTISWLLSLKPQRSLSRYLFIAFPSPKLRWPSKTWKHQLKYSRHYFTQHNLISSSWLKSMSSYMLWTNKPWSRSCSQVIKWILLYRYILKETMFY